MPFQKLRNIGSLITCTIAFCIATAVTWTTPAFAVYVQDGDLCQAIYGAGSFQGEFRVLNGGTLPHCFQPPAIPAPTGADEDTVPCRIRPLNADPISGSLMNGSFTYNQEPIDLCTPWALSGARDAEGNIVYAVEAPSVATAQEQRVAQYLEDLINRRSIPGTEIVAFQEGDFEPILF